MILPPLVFNRSNNNNFPNVSLVGPKRELRGFRGNPS